MDNGLSEMKFNLYTTRLRLMISLATRHPKQFKEKQLHQFIDKINDHQNICGFTEVSFEPGSDTQ
jgi:hypothetical protein